MTKECIQKLSGVIPAEFMDIENKHYDPHDGNY